jgi:uncharacterized repeat protein (TIGR01451 family)
MSRARTKPRAAAVAFALALTIAAAAWPRCAAAASLFSESFANATANGWVYGSSGTPQTMPCLTASQTSVGGSIPGCPQKDSRGLNATGGNSGTLPDAVGQGALRLTDQGGNQSGFVLYNTPISTANGVAITFDYYSYGGNGADGMGFLIVDGSQSPTTAGGYGGSLGYAVHTPTPGIVGGYVGVGFDEFGNFSNPTEGRNGGPGSVPDAVAIRGAAATNYTYITGVTAPQSLDFPSSTTRTGTVRHIRITLTPAGIMSVDVAFSGYTYTNLIYGLNLKTVTGQPSVPATIKIGFAGSTGGSTNIHEVNNVAVTSGFPQLAATKTHAGNFAAGGTGTYSLAVNNLTGTLSTAGAIALVDTLPAGLTYNSYSGTNWACTSAPPLVNCTYSGGALAPGTGVSSTLSLTVNVLASAIPGTLTNTAQASGGGATSPSAIVSDPTTVTGSANLSIVKTGTAQAAPGGLLTYQIVVSNAGPAVAPNVAFSDPVPAGLTIKGTPTCAATAPATCGAVAVSGQNVTSTIASIGVGGKVMFTFNVAPPLTGYASSYTNTATIAPPSYLTDTNGTTTSSLTTSVGQTYGLNKTVRNVTAGEATGGASDTAKPGDVLEYTLSFTNLTGAPLSATTLTDIVPAQTTYVPSSATCSIAPAGGLTCTPAYNAGTLTWTITGGTLSANTAITAVFRVTVN